MTKKKIMVAIKYFDEYYNNRDDDNHSTMEIFESIEEAYQFAKNVKFICAFIADFNKKYIYQEENKKWNYTDNSELFDYSEKFDFPDLLKFN